MQEKSSIYRSIAKGTAIFGGVQIFSILINLVRGKFVAVLLGPEGMGISSLLTVSTNTIQQFSSLGLNLSAVKEIAVAKEKRDANALFFIVSVTRRLLYVTASLGALFSILFSSYLSNWAFGTEDYKWHFVFLSIAIYFMTLSNGELSILQGAHEIKKLAYSSIIGSCVGLFVGIPLYYFYGYDGIVPAMIALSLVTYIFYRYNARNLLSLKENVSWEKMLPIARKMISLGVIMVIATMLGTGSNYILNAFISNYGSLNDVGLYQAANSITNQYVGLVFTAMSLDFFPRLSAVSYDNNKVMELVNQQSEIVILVIAPIAIILIITAPLLIQCLLTDKFISLVPVIRWMGLGIFFKAIAFPMGYISFSKGDRKTFLWLEGIWGNMLTLSLNLLFYLWGGLIGIGISFVLSYIIFNITYIYITRKLYSFSHNKNVNKLIMLFLFLLTLAFCCSFIENKIISYISMIFIWLLTSLYSLFQLNKRLSFFK